MLAIITIVVIIYIIRANSNDPKAIQRRNYKAKKREMKRLQRERERAEMDAWEDMIMYMEAWYD